MKHEKTGEGRTLKNKKVVQAEEENLGNKTERF